MKKYIKIICVLSLICQLGQAQEFEIRTRNAGAGNIAVDLRKVIDPALTSDAFLTDLVFGIKWSEAYDVNLTEIENTGFYNIEKSGIEELKDGFKYQAFYANNTPFNLPSDWSLNEWVQIMLIPNSLEGDGVGTFEIAELGFDLTTDPNIGINLEDFSPSINGSATGVSLPVEILNFTVKSKDNKAFLNWETNIEINSDYFEVQKSRDRTNWTKIGTVAAQGSSNSLSFYNYTDENILANNNSLEHMYYRLNMVDLDGSFQFSPIRSVRITDYTLTEISIYPNPTQGELIIDITSPVRQNVIIQILDLNGRFIQEQELKSSKNTIDINHLHKGNYIVKYTDNQQVETFVIQKY
jgi:hypothetical protein